MIIWSRGLHEYNDAFLYDGGSSRNEDKARFETVEKGVYG